MWMKQTMKTTEEERKLRGILRGGGWLKLERQRRAEEIVEQQ